MDDLVNTNGRGPLGTPINSPISDGGTMPLTQNRPNVSRGKLGATGESGSSGGGRSSNLTDADRQFIQDIHRSKHLDGTPFRLDELLYLRSENARMQEEAVRDFGPTSTSALWFREVLKAYDQEIAKAKSPMGSAVNELKTLLADPAAKEKEMGEKIVKILGVMRQEQLMGVEDDPAAQEAMPLISRAIERAGDQRTAALDDLIKKEKGASGTVPDDKFREAIAAVMGIERQRQLLGMSDDEDGDKKTQKVNQAVTEVIHLASERRIKSLKALIEQETKSMGSVSDQKFKQLLTGVMGDEREKQLLGISDDASLGLGAVVDVMKLILKRRQAAIEDLFKKQALPGSGVTNDQVNQGIKDYDAIKAQAKQLGMAVPEGDVIPGAPQFGRQ